MTEKKQAVPKSVGTRPQNKATGQKRSLERGKSTRKKNPGKRATQGG